MADTVRPRIDPATSDAVKRAAEQRGISESAYVRQAVRDQLRKDGALPPITPRAS